MKKLDSARRLALVALGCSLAAMAQSGGKEAPQPSTFTTLVTTPRGIEGMTGDNLGNLFLAASTGAAPCPIWQVNLGSPSLVLVGNIPASLIATCNSRGLAFNRDGALFVLDRSRPKVRRRPSFNSSTCSGPHAEAKVPRISTEEMTHDVNLIGTGSH